MLITYEEALESIALTRAVRIDDRAAALELFGRPKFTKPAAHYFASTNPAQRAYVPTTKPKDLKTWKFVIGYKTYEEAALFAMLRSGDRLDMKAKEIWTSQKNVNVFNTRRFWIWEFDGTDMMPFVPDGLTGDRWTKIQSYRSTPDTEFSNIKVDGEFNRDQCAKKIGWTIKITDPAPPKPGGLATMTVYSG